jgi:hypothetical protein
MTKHRSLAKRLSQKWGEAFRCTAIWWKRAASPLQTPVGLPKKLFVGRLLSTWLVILLLAGCAPGLPAGSPTGAASQPAGGQAAATLAGPSETPAAPALADLPTGEVYLPPTAAPQTPLVIPLPAATATPAPTSEAPRPSATPVCSADLKFVQDATVPDGSIVAPGAIIDKRWIVENSGDCNWDERFRLRLIEGAEMSAATEQALYPARSGTQAVLRILFTAPSEPGVYLSAWQAIDPLGQPFGEIIYMQIEVR